MNAPPVTVLMPNHNGARFIAASIRSVLEQSFTDYELLIIEDASTDNSLQVIGEFQDPRIRVLRLEQNEHICVGLNLGLQQARGKYIARIDSDDCWHPTKLEKQIAYMQAHPECGACFTWVDVVDEQDRRLSRNESAFVDLFHAENRPRVQWVHDFYTRGSCLCHPSAVFPRAVVEELGGYRNSLVQIQDFDLWIRIAKKHEIHVLEEPLMNYRHALDGGNVSASTPENNVRSYYEMYNVIGHYFDDLSDESFREVFRQEFTWGDASTHEELECERMLLLLKPVFCGHVGKLRGMDMLADLLDRENTRLLLRDKYAITQMNFYQLSKSNVFFMEAPEDALYQLQSSGLLDGAAHEKIAAQLPWMGLVKAVLRKVLRRFPKLYTVTKRFYHRLKQR